MADPPIPDSNRLPILAAEIRAAHGAVKAAARVALERAREAGNLLIEAKDALPHGGWLPWLREVGITPRTAQGYMQLARMPETKYATVAQLGLRHALQQISDRPHLPLQRPGEVMQGLTGRPTGDAFEREFMVLIWRSPDRPGFFDTLVLQTHFESPGTGQAIGLKRPIRGSFVARWLEIQGLFLGQLEWRPVSFGEWISDRRNMVLPSPGGRGFRRRSAAVRLTDRRPGWRSSPRPSSGGAGFPTLSGASGKRPAPTHAESRIRIGGSIFNSR